MAPYAVTFYVTHKCNLACTYCTQKEPDVFSDEPPTAATIRLLRRIRRETDSIVITGGEPTLRIDIEEIVEVARFTCNFRSVLLITNGTLLDRKPRILSSVTGLVVSLDALAADPTNSLSKPAALCFPTMFPRVYPNGDVVYPCEPLRKIAGNLLAIVPWERFSPMAKDCTETFLHATVSAISSEMCSHTTT